MDPTSHPSYTHREYQQWNLPQQQRVNSISHILPSGDHEGQPVSEVSYFQGAHGFVDTGAIYLTINGNFDARPQPPPPFPPGNRFSPTPQRTCPEMKCSFYENAYDFMIDAPTFLSIDGDVQGPLDPSLFYPTAPNAYTPRQPRPMTVLPACNAHVPITSPRRPSFLQAPGRSGFYQQSSTFKRCKYYIAPGNADYGRTSSSPEDAGEEKEVDDSQVGVGSIAAGGGYDGLVGAFLAGRAGGSSSGVLEIGSAEYRSPENPKNVEQ